MTCETARCSQSSCDKQAKVSFWLSWRMVVVWIAFLGANLHNVMRNMAGVTMVCMVNSTSKAFLNDGDSNGTYAPLSEIDNILNQTDVCRPSEAVRDEYLHGSFDWTTKQQGYILGAMAWGQLLSLVPAGFYGHRCRPKTVLTCAFLLGAACTFAVPFAAQHGGYMAMVVLRVLVGVYAGVVWPCMNSLITRWVPAAEMCTMYGIVTAGNQLATIILMPLTTFVCKQRHVLDGWPLMYYGTALLVVLWAGLWWLLVTDYPEQHKRVSRAELKHILGGFSEKRRHGTRHIKTPYARVIFSLPSLACTACMAAGLWGVTFLLYYTPSYFRDVLFMDLNSNGEFSALPFTAQILLKLTFSYLADRMKRARLNPNWIIKGFNTLGMFSFAVFSFGATFLNCHQSYLVACFFCLALGLYSAVTPGFLASGLLIAPQYAGLISAVSSFVGTFSQMLVPYAVGYFVVESTVDEYRLVFGIGCILQLLSGTMFLVWGSGEVMPWAREHWQDAKHASGKDEPEKKAVEHTKMQAMSIDKANEVQVEEGPLKIQLSCAIEAGSRTL